MAGRVGLSRHFTKFSEFVCRNILLWYGSTHAQIPNAHFCHVLHSVMFSTETKNYHNTPQHNRKHNRAPCPTAPSAHASYKGYGCNNAKPPRLPHRNTMIDVVVLGCGPIRTGEGAAASFIRVNILPVGGFVTLAESRWVDLIGPSIPVQKINHTTINHRGPLCVRRIGGIFDI